MKRKCLWKIWRVRKVINRNEYKTTYLTFCNNKFIDLYEELKICPFCVNKIRINK